MGGAFLFAMIVPAGGCGERRRAEEAETAPRGAAPRTIIVAAAASLREVLTEMSARYEEARPDARVQLTFGASNVLARQILEGAPADVLFAADERTMDAVAKGGRVVGGSRVALLSNALVVLIPADDARATITSGKDLLSSAVRHIAVCDEATPIGHYARAWLASQGLLAAIQDRLVQPEDARAALAMVESGAVDAGFVYRTDARLARRARVAFAIPAAETPGIVYPAAALSGGGDPEGGRDFLAFASSPPAVWLFRGAGFTVLAPR